MGNRGAQGLPIGPLVSFQGSIGPSKAHTGLYLQYLGFGFGILAVKGPFAGFFQGSSI